PDDCVGELAKVMARELRPGEVLLLENTRFHKEEEGKVKLPETATDEEKSAAKAAMKKKQEELARQLSEYGDVFVNDAFGTAHRAHASTSVVCKFFKENVAGFLMEKEIEHLTRALTSPQRPFVTVLGGAKVSDKVNVIRNLLSKVDSIIIGGGMAYTFYLARGLPVGNSLVEREKVPLAEELLREAQHKGVKLLLPVDHVVADKFAADAATKIVGERGIEEGWIALDIGPKTVRLFTEEISKAKTVIWNGPMGCFEMKPFAGGTVAVARAIASTQCLSIVGGGDSVAAVNSAGLADRFTHVSTGGGATLEFLEGRILPGVAALSDRT
ncbi:MAG: phosphoglycerate kinase, partial [Kiritimatiellae bacterium]|nr:phosphoglycerate kinase [Kiritimatiellia bacterium]